MPKLEIQFNKNSISNLPTPDKGKRLEAHDKKNPGLIIRVTDVGTKTFYAYKRIARQAPRRLKLGRYPDMTIEQARRTAKGLISEMAEGIHPRDKEKEAKRKTKVEKLSNITLQAVFDDYFAAKKNLKEGTIKDYKIIRDVSFKDWKDKSIRDISRDLITNKHNQLGRKSEARANNAMRVLRALFNFAIQEYIDTDGNPIFTDNPVTKLSHNNAWFRVERRRQLIKTHELGNWFNAVLSLKGKDKRGQAETVRDYLILLILTGLRREEASKLKWRNIDFGDKTLTVNDTKNREIHILPLSDYLFDILNNRRANDPDGKYVFPSKTSKSGHLINANKQIQKVKDETGIDFSAHDLRRTFATIAEGRDISAYALKRLLNHKMNHDVTAGYIIMDIERLREPMQSITDFILKAAGIKKTAEVVDIKSKQI